MKKTIILLCVTAMLLSLCACFRPLPELKHESKKETHEIAKPTESVSMTEEDTLPPTEETEASWIAPELSECIGLYTEASVNYSDGCYNDYNATYQVPEILLDSSDAKRANDMIQAHCNESIDDSLQAEMDKVSLFCFGISYDAWIYDHYLSLVIFEQNDWDCNYYMVFTFDLMTGRWLGNKEYAEYLSMDESALFETIRSSLLYHFDDMNSAMPDEYKDEFFNEQREGQYSDDNVKETELYIGRDGSVQMCCWVKSIAGADAYMHLLPLIK